MAAWIVASGNLASGFTFYGPWSDPMDAMEWAQDHAPENKSWVMLPLSPPEVPTPMYTLDDEGENDPLDI